MLGSSCVLEFKPTSCVESLRRLLFTKTTVIAGLHRQCGNKGLENPDNVADSVGHPLRKECSRSATHEAAMDF